MPKTPPNVYIVIKDLAFDGCEDVLTLVQSPLTFDVISVDWEKNNVCDESNLFNNNIANW
jgi:hypothetical protein